ncbi:hypothetical protein DFS34DRAFT_691394 [Phlyctochytrium arcticum]|nr:hypothetical protein DFS34DRAFT_691394 [Phlyctochytrium arcticum]
MGESLSQEDQEKAQAPVVYEDVARYIETTVSGTVSAELVPTLEAYQQQMDDRLRAYDERFDLQLKELVLKLAPTQFQQSTQELPRMARGALKKETTGQDTIQEPIPEGTANQEDHSDGSESSSTISTRSSDHSNSSNSSDNKEPRHMRKSSMAKQLKKNIPTFNGEGDSTTKILEFIDKVDNYVSRLEADSPDYPSINVVYHVVSRLTDTAHQRWRAFKADDENWMETVPTWSRFKKLFLLKEFTKSNQVALARAKLHQVANKKYATVE